LGHFTNRVRSLFGGNAPPIPNCFGRFSNKGFDTFSYNKQTQKLKPKTQKIIDESENDCLHTGFFFAAATGAFPPFFGALSFTEW